MGLGGGAGSYGEILQTRNVGVGEGSNGGFKGSGRGDTSKTHGGGAFYISIFLYFYISIYYRNSVTTIMYFRRRYCFVFTESFPL